MAPEGHIVMSELEIAARCQHLGIPRPPTLPNVALDQDAIEVPVSPAAELPWVKDLLATLGRPLVVVFAHHQESGSTADLGVFAVLAPWAAEQVAQPGSVYSLSLFPAADIVDRVVAGCRLSERTASSAGACELSSRGFLEAIEQAAADPAQALGLLRAEGIATSDARALVAALSACERRVQVTVLRRLETGRLEGSTAAWFDGGAGGLWRVDVPMLASSGDYGDYGEALLDRTTVTVSPTTRASLLDEVMQGFPDGWRVAR